MNRGSVVTFAIMSLAGSLPASAHHSAAAFDREHPYTLRGTIKEFTWTNPHIWVSVLVPDGKGGMDEYQLEGPGTSGMAHNGWNSKSLQPGDAAKFLVAPYKDGTKRGEFMAVWRGDGTLMKF